MRWKTCLSSCRNFVPGVSLFSAIRCQLSIESTFTRITYQVFLLFAKPSVFLSRPFDVVTPATHPITQREVPFDLYSKHIFAAAETLSCDFDIACSYISKFQL